MFIAETCARVYVQSLGVNVYGLLTPTVVLFLGTVGERSISFLPFAPVPYLPLTPSLLHSVTHSLGTEGN